MKRIDKLLQRLAELEASVNALLQAGERVSAVNVAAQHARVANIIRRLRNRVVS